MQVLKIIINSKQGKLAIASIVVGILIASVGGNLAKGIISTDIIVILGSIISLVGTQTISRMIIAYRDQENSEE